MTEPNKKQTSGTNDNLVKLQAKSTDALAFDPRMFDSIIESNLSRHDQQDQSDLDHPICHLY